MDKRIISDIETVRFNWDEHADMLPNFSCGEEEEHKALDQYFNDFTKCPDAKLYIVRHKKSNEIIGLFALSCSSVTKTEYQFKYPPSPDVVPAIELKAFALSEEYQHQTIDGLDERITIGDIVIGLVKSQVKWIVNNVCGARYIILYSVYSAISFYKRNGFSSFNEYVSSKPSNFSSDCYGMFMSIEEM